MLPACFAVAACHGVSTTNSLDVTGDVVSGFFSEVQPSLRARGHLPTVKGRETDFRRGPAQSERKPLPVALLNTPADRLRWSEAQRKEVPQHAAADEPLLA